MYSTSFERSTNFLQHKILKEWIKSLLKWFMLCQSSLILLHKTAFQPFWLPVTVSNLFICYYYTFVTKIKNEIGKKICQYNLGKLNLNFSHCLQTNFPNVHSGEINQFLKNWVLLSISYFIFILSKNTHIKIVLWLPKETITGIKSRDSLNRTN